MAQGVEQFRRNLEELRRSPEWAKFKDQVARLSAQLTATGAALTQLLGEQLPKLQKELDDLYAEYQKELEKARRERTPAPQP
jgi:ABC-type transporter Mla subunit MlaD